ncbi:hypothetical protein A9Q83_05395 [Alphaproteobacteria bacterium 46_93_T64]|nr:hypothetical protein A9Q83_05395 [Alphaproteobacteria bacterium 46_93_T64]
MRNRFLKLILILWTQLFLSGCALGPDPILVAQVNDIARGISDLAVTVDRKYDVTEKAHKAALKNNINLQFELGGSPDVTREDLFTLDDRAARRAILSAMQVYSANLVAAYAASEDSTEISLSTTVNALPFSSLSNLKIEDFDVSHSLDKSQSKKLIASLSGFSKFLFYPKRDKKIVEILIGAHPFIEQAASLLYLDIGTPKDQSENCDNPLRADVQIDKIGGLRLCRGGVRGLMKAAVASNQQTWKLRLQLANLNKSTAASTRNQIVDRLHDLEQFGRQQDHSMKMLQEALVRMVSAHHQLATAFSKTYPVSVPPLQTVARSSPDPVSEFSAQVESLSQTAKRMDAFFDTSTPENNE